MSARRGEPVPAASAPRLALAAVQRRILVAAVSRILPSDDGPGATETGVAEYIERALGDPWHRHFRPLFERGLGFFEVLAWNTKGKDFASCTADEQDEVLRVAEEFPNNDARRFFVTLVHLALEGFLCPPSHGGNRGELGWKYFRFEPQVPGPCSAVP
jgi:gluconate 2-dehydrogenase gamma chain